MALKSTICKAELRISDLDRGYYATHNLTLARHPSETDERMMVRLLAFALHATERTYFGRGLSTEDEPDIFECDDTGAYRLWIDVGMPGERHLRKACARSASVIVLAYGGRSQEVWWQENAPRLTALANLAVYALPPAVTRGMAEMAARAMVLDCTIQEGQAWVSAGDTTIEIAPLRLGCA